MKTHRTPRKGQSLTPCCGQNPFDLPRTDRMTNDDQDVTCMSFAVQKEWDIEVGGEALEEPTRFPVPDSVVMSTVDTGYWIRIKHKGDVVFEMKTHTAMYKDHSPEYMLFFRVVDNQFPLDALVKAANQKKASDG